jgi:hypothetical protein
MIYDLANVIGNMYEIRSLKYEVADAYSCAI